MNCLQFCRWTVFNSVGELSSKCVSVNCPVGELSRFQFLQVITNRLKSFFLIQILQDRVYYAHMFWYIMTGSDMAYQTAIRKVWWAHACQTKKKQQSSGKTCHNPEGCRSWFTHQYSFEQCIFFRGQWITSRHCCIWCIGIIVPLFVRGVLIGHLVL